MKNVTEEEQADIVQLIRKFEPYVRALARRMHARIRILDADELHSVGLWAVHEAIRKYDPARGSFFGYLRRRAKWAMTTAARRRHKRFNPNRGRPLGIAKRYFDDQARPVRVSPIQEDLYLPSLLEFRGTASPGGIIATGDMNEAAIHCDDGPERLVLRRQIDAALKSAIRELPSAQRTILMLHYFAGERFAAIAKMLNMTRARVSQHHRLGLNRCEQILTQRGFSRELVKH